MISEKYLAGFIDADGHISIRCRKGARPDIEVSMSQRKDFLEPLIAAQEMFGGAIRDKYDGEYQELQLRCGPATKCVERLKKYLVIKGGHANEYLSMLKNAPVLKSDSDVKTWRNMVKAVRKTKLGAVKNYPSRKWMAGYIDGDGCFSVKVCKKTGYAYPSLSILSAPNYTAGIELIKKAFGGRICMVNDNHLLQIGLSQPDKAKKIIGHSLKYFIKKRDVSRFINECARNGNFRDGEPIRDAIKTFNSQQHRLSDSTVNVKDMVKTINFSIPKKKIGRPSGVKDSTKRRKRQSGL